MKRLLLLLLCSFMTIAASAQYAVQNVPVLKGSRVFVDGEKISNADVVAYLASAYDDSVAEDWNKKRNAYKTGLGLTIAGPVLIICGEFVGITGLFAMTGTMLLLPILGIVGGSIADTGAVVSGFSDAGLWLTIGGCTILTGYAMLASGIPVMCVYKKKLKKMFQEYGPGLSSDINLSFGPTCNGFGFALNF